MANLSGAITTATTRLELSAPVTGLTIDSILILESEKLVFVNYGTGLDSYVDHSIVIVERGTHGTTAATHADATPLVVGASLATAVIFEGSGAPVDGTTGAGFAGGGSIYVRTAAGNVAAFLNTGTAAATVWKAITHA